MQEAFFDERSNTGFLSARIKNVNRAEPRNNCKTSSTEPKKSKKAGGPSQAHHRDKVHQHLSIEDLEGDVNWLKSVPQVNQRRDAVFEKMARTCNLRRSMVQKNASATDIINEFPCLKTTLGLVSYFMQIVDIW